MIRGKAEMLGAIGLATMVAQADVVCAAPPFVKSAPESVRGLQFQPAIAREGPVKSYMLVEFGYGKGYPCARIPD